jgi:hypothetical protein
MSRTDLMPHISLNENLPQPVIDVPIPEDTKKGEQGKLF